MYSYIKVLIVDIQSDHIVLENNGIGYLIYVSNPYAFSKGKEVVVYLYQQVKEDGILLYGFNLKEEKDLFLKLISVKGIGCKSACTMLASGDVEGICEAIESGNMTYLKKIPGIGPKAAGQIILDLQGKVNIYNETGEKLETEQLYFDQKNEWFFTQKKFKFSSTKGVSYGEGIDFSKDFKKVNSQKISGEVNESE